MISREMDPGFEEHRRVALLLARERRDEPALAAGRRIRLDVQRSCREAQWHIIC